MTQALSILPAIREGEHLPRWPRALVRWTVLCGLAPLPDQECLDAFAWAWDWWASVCGIRPVYVPSPDLADVVMEFATLGGVLAWSEFPSADGIQRRVRFNRRVPWCFSDQPPASKVDLGAVALHEVGHCGVGLSHLSKGNAMYERYAPANRALGLQDIEEAVRRYGPPVSGRAAA